MVGAASLIGNGISLIFWLVLASLMDAEQYGEINYFIAISLVIASSLEASYFVIINQVLSKKVE